MRQMLWKSSWGVIAALMLAAPAHAQLSSFELPTPPSTRAVGGQYVIRWDTKEVSPLYSCLYSVTWYYSRDRTGQDRKRITTLFSDDFSNGLRGNWVPQGQFLFDWEVKQERGTNRRYLVAPKFGGPAISRDVVPIDSVVSALVQPLGIKSDFSIGLGIQPNGRGFELQNTGDVIRVVSGGRVVAGGERRALGLNPSQWYWYEIGLHRKGRGGRTVEIRVRVFDEKREKVVLQFEPIYERVPFPMESGGLLQLQGPAKFAAIHVDPWWARWADDRKNQLIWNTQLVPDGDYYLIAEVHDGRGAPQLVTSSYQVQVRNGSPAAAGN